MLPGVVTGLLVALVGGMVVTGLLVAGLVGATVLKGLLVAGLVGATVLKGLLVAGPLVGATVVGLPLLLPALVLDPPDPDMTQPPFSSEYTMLLVLLVPSSLSFSLFFSVPRNCCALAPLLNSERSRTAVIICLQLVNIIFSFAVSIK